MKQGGVQHRATYLGSLEISEALDCLGLADAIVNAKTGAAKSSSMDAHGPGECAKL